MMNRLMQVAHEAGLQVGTNSVDMPIIIPIKDGQLCTPEEAITAFAAFIANEAFDSVVQAIEQYEAIIKDCTAKTDDPGVKQILYGRLQACADLKEKFDDL